ncbi:MAG: DinB family protein [Anaerolineales bacterium]
MNPNRQHWNASHQKLHRALSTADRAAATELFLSIHAMVHSAQMSKSGLWSFEDEVLCDLSNDQIRTIPHGGEHSIAWIMFHLTRCEDITMNMLVAGTEQLFTQNDWAKKMNVQIIHSANSMDDVSMAKLSAEIDIKALKAYRIAVGRRTRQIVKKLKADDYNKPVDPLRAQKLMDADAVSPDAMEIFHYWATRTIAGLLLMPPTRHCFLHWNEALKIKKKLLK